MSRRLTLFLILFAVLLAPFNFLKAVAATKIASVESVFKSRALTGDSRKSNKDWNEFFHSPQGVFQANNAYTITFKYRVIDCASDANFYVLLRSKNKLAGDICQQDWRKGPGETGTITIPVFAFTAPDYYLIIGVKNKGAIAIDDLNIDTDPSNVPLKLSNPSGPRTWKSKGHTNYYVDSEHGDDTASGTSQTAAWQTLTKVNAGTLAPGDHVLLKSGSRWHGYLSPAGVGSDQDPIVVDKYGAGPKPRIDTDEEFAACVHLYNCAYFELRNLELTNSGPVHQPGLTGVYVQAQDFGELHHLVLSNLDIHDLTGCTSKHGGGQAIVFLNGGKNVKTRYDGILVEGCHIWHVDRDGITMYANNNRDNWYPNLHVVIRKNFLEDIGGDGIVPSSCDGALVEKNILRGGLTRALDSAAGIWPGSCDNTVVQFNEVSGMKGTHDGEGYDSDWNCRNSLFQYNFSHDNAGGFMLICNDGDLHMPKNIGNSGTIVRYNISVNDGLHTFNITGPCANTQIYNNVIVVGKSSNQPIVNGGNWGKAWPNNTRFQNNIFYVEGNGAADFKLGGMTNVVFDRNAYWGQLTNRPQDAHAINANPELVKPGSLRAQDYKLKAASPCLHNGESVAKEEITDYQGDPVVINSRPSVGAFQNAKE